tara:strand:+ start:725 stop:1282 length:558 start_codon:yes stop_codon:yes gene_type:complete
MSEEENEPLDEKIQLSVLDKDETDLDTILGFLIDSGEPDLRGNALLRLETIGVHLSQKDLDFSIEILKKARKVEEVGKLIGKIDELLNKFWQYKKELEFEGIENPFSMEEEEEYAKRTEAYAKKLKDRKYADPIRGETVDHLANLRALPVIEDHLYWISLWAKILIVCFVLSIILWIIVFIVLAA